MANLENLKNKRDFYYRELEDLHMYEPREEWLNIRRHEIESEICFIEDAIDEIERQQNMNQRILKYALIGLGIASIIGLISLL
jgi:hypothetical protein